MFMGIEWFILYFVWGVTAISLFFIPQARLREASISYLFLLFVSWFAGLLVVELNLIKYPVRELASVNKTSFTFEFFVYPVIGIFFNLFYPENRSRLLRFLYSSAICTGIIIPEVIIERYTDLIEYVHWTWYVSWISVFATLSLLRLFYSWFFKLGQEKDSIYIEDT